jgi:tetratricopeptide (TPR) repeat protein
MAWAHLSGSWSTHAAVSDPPVIAREHMDGATRAADTALELAPGLGAAHAARAYLQVYGFDYQGALAECRRAVQLAPEDGTVLNGCGYVFAQVGKLGEAIQARKHLLSIEPLYIVNYQQYARSLMATGRMDEAEKYLRVSKSLPKKNPYWYSSTASLEVTVALMRGDADAAMGIVVQMPTENRGLYMALATQIGPDRSAADAALANVLASKAEADAYPYLVAQIYALRGDAGHAVQWLQRASTGDLLFLPTDPFILNLRHDPQFIAFCEKVGLLPPSESEALSIDQIRALSAVEHL